jgi:hypothetical protein
MQDIWYGHGVDSVMIPLYITFSPPPEFTELCTIQVMDRFNDASTNPRYLALFLPAPASVEAHFAC